MPNTGNTSDGVGHAGLPCNGPIHASWAELALGIVADLLATPADRREGAAAAGLYRLTAALGATASALVRIGPEGCPRIVPAADLPHAAAAADRWPAAPVLLCWAERLSAGPLMFGPADRTVGGAPVLGLPLRPGDRRAGFVAIAFPADQAERAATLSDSGLLAELARAIAGTLALPPPARATDAGTGTEPSPSPAWQPVATTTDLMTAIDALPDAFVLFDSKERLVFCNAHYTAVYPRIADAIHPGAHRADILRRAVEAGLYRDAVGQEERFFQEMRRQHAAPCMDRVVALSDGRWMRLLDRATPEGGRVGLRIDVTALKQAEARLARIIEAAKIGTWEWHVQTGENIVNEGWASIVGYTLDELGGARIETWRKLLHPEDLSAVEGVLARVMAREVAQFEHEFRMRHKDGHWVSVVSQGRVVRWSHDGKPLLMAGIHTDVTERRAREAALEAANADLARALAERDAAEQRFADIARVNSDWFWEMDQDLRYTYLSEGYQRSTGGDPAEKIGLSRADILAKYPEAASGGDWDRLAGIMARREPFTDFVYRAAMVGTNAQPIWIRMSGAPHFDRFGRFAGYRGVAANITQLYMEKERAEAASREKSRFLANMSHEIRTPLTGILGMAELLDERIADPGQKAMLATLRESGEGLLQILNDILDLAKIEAGRLKLEAIAFVPADIAHRVEALHAPQAAKRGIGFSVEACGDSRQPRIGDPLRLTQILHNLIGNAIKFTEAGSVRVTVEAHRGGALVLEISDTGIGMTEAEIARVFDEFEQAAKGTPRRFGGTGLGLSITQLLVRMMGGHMTISSRPGAGTRIVVTLPIPEASEPGPTRARAAADTAAAPPILRGCRVLLADDNDTNRFLLRTMLSQLGMLCAEATDGGQAVAAFRPGAFDLVLLDISMPVLDGVAALAALRAAERAAGQPPVPVVAITANAMDHQVAEYRAAGFDAHLAKPFRRADLVATISALIAAKPCGTGDGTCAPAGGSSGRARAEKGAN